MHIPEGILPTPVLATGAVIAAAGVAVGLRTLTDKQMVKVAVMSSAFFVASLVQIPIGATSVHLVLAGLMGLLLGWAVFPAVAVALTLQALLFGIGGLSTLGVNTIIMAVPGLTVYLLFAPMLPRTHANQPFLIGFVAGVTALLLATILQAGAILLTGREFAVVASAVILGHIPIMIAEGFVTAWAVVFLRKVRPETFHVFDLTPIPAEQSVS